MKILHIIRTGNSYMHIKNEKKKEFKIIYMKNQKKIQEKNKANLFL